ncbi:MAG: hypothetical protein ACYSWZ_18530 [Planctomycetota bacterium]|jgi:hypothetical protein
MDINEIKNLGGGGPKPEPQEPKPVKPVISSDVLDLNTWKRFSQLTGGSILYCLSAVLIIYGVVKLMGPVLSGEGVLKDALPCILTLHVYELALLGVLVLIVSRKVVDDAISIVILMALFLVGTSMALGSVTDKGLATCFYIGLVSILVAFGKFHVVRRYVRIPFRALSLVGLGGLIAINYMGPILMARSVALEPAQEPARRDLWLFLWLSLLIAAGFVLIEALREKNPQQKQGNNQAAFLQTSTMVYVFALIVVIASGVHQYAMAFAFALERVLGDFVPVTTLAALLLLEIPRRWSKRCGIREIVISCVPLALMLLAIEEKSVLASGEFGPGLLFYPPVWFGLTALAIAAIGWYHRWKPLGIVAFAYVLGVILTAGFSPERPHDLNFYACIGTLVVAIILYGLFVRNPNLCLAGIIILCSGLSFLDSFSKFAASYKVTEVGGLAGVFGLGTAVLYLLFGIRLHKAVRIISALCLAGFMFDYLQDYTHLRYLVVLLCTGLLAAGFSFVLLGAGTFVSLLKRPRNDKISQDEHGDRNKNKISQDEHGDRNKSPSGTGG